MGAGRDGGSSSGTDGCPSLSLASRRILVVDDQPSLRGLLEVSLTEAGALVWSAADGQAALELLDAAQPELILLDLFMPGMDGWQVLSALQASRYTAVPVVLETSAEDFDNFARARRQGVAAFVSKPFRIEELLETCRRVLDGARPLQGRPAPERAATGVRVEDEDGRVLASGELLDLASHGAQVALDTLLSLGLRLRLVIEDPEGIVTRRGEVRWASRVEERYHHGLSLRGE